MEHWRERLRFLTERTEQQLAQIDRTCDTGASRIETLEINARGYAHSVSQMQGATSEVRSANQAVAQQVEMVMGTVNALVGEIQQLISKSV